MSQHRSEPVSIPSPTTYPMTKSHQSTKAIWPSFLHWLRSRSFKQAAKDARWIEAMRQEIMALEDNKT